MPLAVALDPQGDPARLAVEEHVGVGDDVLGAVVGAGADHLVGDAAHAVGRVALLGLGRELGVAGRALPHAPVVVGVEPHERDPELAAPGLADAVVGLKPRWRRRQRRVLGELGDRREGVDTAGSEGEGRLPGLQRDLGMPDEGFGQLGVIGQVDEAEGVAAGHAGAEADGHGLGVEAVVDEQQALAHVAQVHGRAGDPRDAVLVEPAGHDGPEHEAALERAAAHQRMGEEDGAIGLELVLAAQGGQRAEVLPRGAVGLELPSQEADDPLVEALEDQPARGERAGPHGLVAADLVGAVAHVAELGDGDGPAEAVLAEPGVAARRPADGGALVDAVEVGEAQVVVVGEDIHLS